MLKSNNTHKETVQINRCTEYYYWRDAFVGLKQQAECQDHHTLMLISNTAQPWVRYYFYTTVLQKY